MPAGVPRAGAAGDGPPGQGRLAGVDNPVIGPVDSVEPKAARFWSFDAIPVFVSSAIRRFATLAR